jgi:hypothetical protein
MKEIPILFRTEMVKAIIEGRKTQTRRIVKDLIGLNRTNAKIASLEEYNLCPFGKDGDLLWVREAHRVFYDAKAKTFTVGYSDGSVKAFYYKSLSLNLIKKLKNRKSLKKGTWVSARFLTKELARIWLQNTGYKIERLNDISEDDAIAEGVQEHEGTCFWKDYNHPEKSVLEAGYFNPISSFESLWQSIHGPDSWKENPWVWAVTFKVISTTGKP